MGHQFSNLVMRGPCGPWVPGEFDLLPDYSRMQLDDGTSSPSRPSNRGSHSSVPRGEEAMPSRRRQRAKAGMDRHLIASALRSSPLFRGVESDEIGRLTDAMEYYEFNFGDVLVKEGGLSSYLFVSSTVGLDLVIQGATAASLGPGQIFGELALLQKCVQSCSVVATRPQTGVWAADSDCFRQAILSTVMNKSTELRDFLGSCVPLLKGLTIRQLDCIADLCTVQTFLPGDVPVRFGSELNHVFFVKTGQLRSVSTKGSSEVAGLLGIGSCIGEKWLLYKESTG
ncbi:unnamed protein product, partial [Polarella glacialis]